MSEREFILRVDATHDLTVKVGDRVRQGERLSQDSSPGATSRVPTSGVVSGIRFDPDHHEFVIVVTRAQ